MRRLNQPLIFLFLGCVAWAQSRDFWEKKDYPQWTDKECRKLLEERSPINQQSAEDRWLW